jgi:hypothetical protein
MLNQAVKRNVNRFPYDFMFQLNLEEALGLVSQNVIPHKKYLGGTLPYAFTEQGVAMLSTVLHSERAIQMNIAIMRAFVKLREFLLTHKELAQKIAELEQKIGKNEEVISLQISKSTRNSQLVTGSLGETTSPLRLFTLHCSLFTAFTPLASPLKNSYTLFRRNEHGPTGTFR